MISQAIKSIVFQYIKNVKKHGIPVEHAFIFGSYAKGKANKHSDIDVCIISKDFGKDRQKERVTLMNIRGNKDDLIEPHPYSPADFTNPYDPLLYQIKKTGVKIT